MTFDLEKALYTNLLADALLLVSFDEAHGEATLCFKSIHDLAGGSRIDQLAVNFKDVRNFRVSRDEDEPADWPLQIIGFDAWAAHQCWKFVLYCDPFEWTWHANWPIAWSDLQPVA